ncbi:MAG: hypothetical protein ACR2RL_11545 [Gammaproteobacteria bacterium]
MGELNPATYSRALGYEGRSLLEPAATIVPALSGVEAQLGRPVP